MSTWYLYLLQNQRGLLYAGISTDPARRLRQHNGELQGGAKALRGKGPFITLYQVACADKSMALRLEYQLKQQARHKKISWFEQLLEQKIVATSLQPADLAGAAVPSE